MSGEWMGVTTTRAPAVLIKYFLYSMDDHFRLAEQLLYFGGKMIFCNLNKSEID